MIARVTSRVLLGAIIAVSIFFPVLHVSDSAEAVGVHRQSITASSNNATTISVSLTSTAIASNLIIVVCAAGATSTMSMGTTGYSVAAPSAGTTVSQGIFYKVAAGGEQTVQCNSSVRTRLGAHIYEYNGVLQSAPFDNTNTAAGTTGTAISTGSVSSTTAYSLVFGAYVAAGGTAFTVNTVGANERQDFRQTTAFGAADLFVNTQGSYSLSITNNASGAWRGQLAVFKLLPTVLQADIVDASGVSVASPSVSMPSQSFGFTCQTVSGTLGVAAQKLRVANGTSSPAWQLSIAPTAGPTASWTNGSFFYDMNDAGSSGCADSGDADAQGGQLSISPAGATLSPALTSCVNTNLSLGTNTAFNQGAVDSIALLTANTSAQINCMWDLTGIGLSQKIPPEQRNGTYTLGLTLTLVAM